MEDNLMDIIARIQQQRVLVIGDMVADIYLDGRISRISREAPVLVLEQEKEKFVPGGAANVVHNVATLGGIVWAVGTVGFDEQGHGLRAALEEKGVNTEGLIDDKNRLTISKTRIIAGGAATVSQQIVRIDRETKDPLSETVEAAIEASLATLLPKVSGVVLSDYGSGTITKKLTRQIFAYCNAHDIPCIIDSRYDLLSFVGAHYIKQNDAEAGKIVGFEIKNHETLLKAGAILLEKMQAKGILITQGSEGMTLFERNGAVHHIPVSNKSEVFDVSGAGDTAVATFILCLSAGVEPVFAAKLANFASGIAVRKLGTAAVTANELKEWIGANG